MGISNSDFKDIKRRLEAERICVQFACGSQAEANAYTGDLGEPIYIEDKHTFSVCDKKSTKERCQYPVSREEPILEDDLDAHLKYMIKFFIKKTPIGALTLEFTSQGSKLNSARLISAFSDTGKFCLPDGRSLPSGCYARRVLGISNAPDLAGRFLRHYGPLNYNTLGSTQEDQFRDHNHEVNRRDYKFSGQGKLIKSYSNLPRESSWYWREGRYKFVVNLETGSHISIFSLPYDTGKCTGYSTRYGSETRPKNLVYACFYRYDL
ncbi:hypothetical protein F0310_04420 (plasmid) [Borrelia sp. A-FGy1]|uniref:hypothetical protein n=1 Tax=Borrelia sp. A-FGy1 TaxID=2608247 RepID=UPI0015F5B4E4|nr:hypothetical protein [Borrelia sp. A-FGy1]QMU99659.1 hypothetical protein F0310_04420 [Borrelia sp. A-FGy1]